MGYEVDVKEAVTFGQESTCVIASCSRSSSSQSPEPVSGLSQGLIAPVQGNLVLVLEISPVISLAVGSLLCFTSSPAPSLMCR